MNKLREIPSTISCLSPVPASAVPDNWCLEVGTTTQIRWKQEGNPGCSGIHTVKEICHVLGGRHLLPRSTSTYTAAIATITSLLCQCVLCGGGGMAGSIQISHLCMQANAALLGTLVNKLQGMRHASTPPLACRISSAIPSHPATRQSMSGCPTFMCLCDSVVCRRESERWCWWTTSAGVPSRKCYKIR